MKHIQPDWLDKKLYPFESKWITIEDHDLHYVDEGQGPVILFVHGTPEWSFGFRDLIKELRHSFRCIAIDLLGFGLSDKPTHANFTCEAHASRLERLIQMLRLKNISLMANDFGASIGMSYAINHPGNMNKIILFNTWMWSLKENKHYSLPAKLMNTRFGRMLYLNFNFPVNVIMPAAYGNKKKLSKVAHSHYKNALKKGERTAPYAFSKELMNASDWWQSLWDRLHILDHKSFLFFWGMKDTFVLSAELQKWKSKLPQAKVVTFEDAGHFAQEEKPKEMVEEILKFLNTEVNTSTNLRTATSYLH